MALGNCKECGNEVSTSAKVCPHCGTEKPTTTALDTFIGYLLLAVVLIPLGIIGNCIGGDEEEEEVTYSAAEKEEIAERECSFLWQYYSSAINEYDKCWEDSTTPGKPVRYCGSGPTKPDC